ncbi:MAG: hypothetical protein IJI68_05190 [Eggerthellaceae bacterium]|nr:hypothetical protein [Eggerthellaceae bacterium]
MEKHEKQLHVRMSQEELNRARNLSGTLDMTLSDLIRTLIQISAPAISETPGSLIVIDRSTALGLRRETRRWGHHFNQAVHALNAIAYYLRLGETDADEVLEELGKVGYKLDSMNSGVALLRAEVADLASHPRAFI